MDHSKEIKGSDLAAARRLGKLYPTRLQELFAAVESGVPERREVGRKASIEAFRALDSEGKDKFVAERQIIHDEEQSRRRAMEQVSLERHKAEYTELLHRLSTVGLTAVWKHWHVSLADKFTGELAPHQPPTKLVRTDCRLYRGKINGGYPIFTVSVDATSRCAGRLYSLRAALKGLESLSAVVDDLIEMREHANELARQNWGTGVSPKASAA